MDVHKIQRQRTKDTRRLRHHRPFQLNGMECKVLKSEKDSDAHGTHAQLSHARDA